MLPTAEIADKLAPHLKVHEIRTVQASGSMSTVIRQTVKRGNVTSWKVSKSYRYGHVNVYSNSIICPAS